MKYSINFATKEDAKNLIEYLNYVAGETDFLSFGKNEFFTSIEKQAEFINSLQNKGVMLIVKDQKQNIIGSGLCLSNERRNSHVFTLSLSIKKQFWNQGIGTNLITKLESESKKIGCKKIMLYVHENNHNAIKLYKKLGYNQEAVLKKDTKIGDHYLDTIVKSKIF